MSHPLKGKWIAHYHIGPTPWQTISDLDKENALGILVNVYAKRYKIRNKARKNSYLQDGYLEDRLAVEDWDRSQHLSRGGKIENPNPVYAMLWDSSAPRNPPWSGQPIVFPAELVPPELMSITIGDSFSNWGAAIQRKFATSTSSVLGKSYSPEEYAGLSRQSQPTAWPHEEHAPHHPQPPFYVEVRIYTRNNLPMQSIADNGISADRPTPRLSPDKAPPTVPPIR